MMIKFVTFLASCAISQVLSDAVEVLPAAVVTSRSSQYFAQNHNAVAAPLVAPVAPVVEAVAPVSARIVAPSSASFSQVIRYGQYLTPASYFAAPLVARGPVAVPVAQPIAPVQPVAAPQPQPQLNPVVPAPNPDAESVDIESAKIRALPQTRNEPADQQRQQFQQHFAKLQQQLKPQQSRRSQASARSQAQPQQQSAAPGFLSQEPLFIQGPY